jgi:hypothetical protein
MTMDGRHVVLCGFIIRRLAIPTSGDSHPHLAGDVYMEKFVMTFRLVEDGNTLQATVRANNLAHARWQLRQAFPGARYVTCKVETECAEQLADFVADD